jgi:glycosyltransferase involved in cell wall biosynthesis
MAVKVCIGVMTYNERDFVAEALGSLLNQSYGDFRLWISDDGSTDGTAEVCRTLAAQDSRVTYSGNPERTGMLANYRKLFAQRDGNAPYFAWAAGHDRYHERWLETLVGLLDSDPEAVLAYTGTASIDVQGSVLPAKSKPWQPFDSAALAPWERVRAVVNAKAFGRMIYGLFRAEAIERAGGIPPVLFPDVVFLWRLACYGDFRFVSERYYYRRETKARMARSAMIARQRRNLFVTPGLRHRLPPLLYNTYYLLRTPLAELPSPLAPRERRIRYLFARHHLARALENHRVWRIMKHPLRTLRRVAQRTRSMRRNAP